MQHILQMAVHDEEVMPGRAALVEKLILAGGCAVRRQK